MSDLDVPDLIEMGAAGGDHEDNDDSDGWDEMEVSGEQTTCLFCSSQFLTIAVALDHCRTEHNFDLLELKNKYNMDCYSFIKMINYIRAHKPDPKIILESSNALWDDDKYLKPGEMESWLMYDFDDLGSAPSTPHYAIDGKTPISNITYAHLMRQIHDLEFQLSSCRQDCDKLREISKKIIESEDSKTDKSACVASRPLACDNSYFSSYSHFGIHHEMLHDQVRTESYRDAILNNVDTFRGKKVLDVGCGTSILSMFAAKAEAEKVYGIDMAEVLYKAMDIVRENNLSDKIHLVKGRLEDTHLPEEKFDIIISEWMGYFLLFEGMLDSIIYARDNHLNEGGVIVPNRCNISIVACSDQEKYDKYINFWDDVYGFSMKCMKSDIFVDPTIEVVPSDKVITTSSILTEIDIKTCTTQAPNFSSNFKLEAIQDGTVTCLAGYFDTFFDLPNPVQFSTGPNVQKTHWQQTVFYLKKTIDVKKGDFIEGTLACTRNIKNTRGLTITITIGEEKYKYYLD